MKPYQRGDVVIIDVPMLANSHIQAGKRPWVVVQNNVGNQFSSTSIFEERFLLWGGACRQWRVRRKSVRYQ